MNTQFLLRYLLILVWHKAKLKIRNRKIVLSLTLKISIHSIGFYPESNTAHWHQGVPVHISINIPSNFLFVNIIDLFFSLTVLKKVKHRFVENMNSNTADALGLSRAILCNGKNFFFLSIFLSLKEVNITYLSKICSHGLQDINIIAKYL